MSVIAEPAIVWYPGQTLDFDCTGVTLANGRTLAEMDRLILSVREDPHWPRRPFQDPNEDMDPEKDGWEEVLLSEDGEAEDSTTVSFDPSSTDTNLRAGVKRYACEVVGEIDGSPVVRVVIVPTTWLTVKAATVSRS